MAVEGTKLLLLQTRAVLEGELTYYFKERYVDQLTNPLVSVRNHPESSWVLGGWSI